MRFPALNLVSRFPAVFSTPAPAQELPARSLNQRNAPKVCAVLLLCSCTVYGQSASENDLKAAFLYRFTEFVEWPAESLSGPESPVRMCVFGSDALADSLER